MEQFNDIPADDLFLIASELRPIADNIAELLGTNKPTPHYEKMAHFRDRVIEWSERCAGAQETQAPIPPPKDPPSLYARFAALAAVHDSFADARWKIDPWAEAREDDSVPAKDYAELIAPHTVRYDSLKGVVDECRLCRSPERFDDYEPSQEQKSNKAALLAWIEDVREDLQSSQEAGGLAVGDAGDGVNTESVQPNFPNPSKPMSKKQAVGEWGGAMTVDKLAPLIKSGRVRCQELNRQLFIFCCDDVPNLEPSRKNQD